MVTGSGSSSRWAFWCSRPTCWRRSFGKLAFERVGRPLAGVDRLGLRGRFIDAERQAAVLQFRVGLLGGGRQEHHHRALDLVALGLLAAGAAVLAGRGDPQPAVALQEFQGVGWPAATPSSSATARILCFRSRRPM